MTLILDAGALIALDRNQRSMWVRLKAAELDHEVPITHGGVVGQVWRDGTRQARLAVALAGTDIRSLDDDLGRAAGLLLARSGTSDVIDAALASMAMDGDEIVTADVADIEALLLAAGTHVEIIRP